MAEGFSLAPFDLREDVWEEWFERFEFYLDARNVTDSGKKKSYLLSQCAASRDARIIGGQESTVNEISVPGRDVTPGGINEVHAGQRSRDDVLITGKSQNDCLQRTSAVLEKLQDAGLRVSEKKCKFCVDSVEYLGHRIDAEGCHPTEAKSLEEEFALDSSRIAALTSRDTLLSRVRQAIETGEWPDEEDIRSFFHRRDELSVIRGVLLWGSRVVVPAKAQKHVLHELHEGHPGVRPPGHHRLGQRSGLHRGGVPAVHEEERHPSCEDGSSQAGVRQSLRQRLRELTGLVARSGRLSPRCNDGGGPAGRWSTVAPSLRSAAVCGRLCSEESHGDGRLRLRTAAGEAGPGGWRAGRGLVGGRSAGGSRGDLGPETGG
ncbi:uncharacterized protein LOC122392189 isoform X9 [Amphibalanus amphitrite]|uniref:uncharacterized protein LOC122392189 isoform X9 n=1 Tax=Amphibalanus amphitrite TaxID=1232801 RepID=UPI001C9009D6|nr:uncharacterized protein LOC122392189 isoform X9 [Amphibalanus amphitrite]